MNILLLGHKGMLGSELFGRLSVHHEVIGKDMDDFDIASAESCQHLISEAGPDVVINAAAYTDVDGCESNRDTCFAVNAEGTKKCGARLPRQEYKNCSLQYGLCL